jgi:hypothetical protein
LTWEIDLLNWTPEFGGQPNVRYLSFDLMQGKKYQLQAEYRDSSEWAREGGGRCAAVTGTVMSDSIEFEVP